MSDLKEIAFDNAQRAYARAQIEGSEFPDVAASEAYERTLQQAEQ